MIRRSLYLLMICATAASLAQAAGQNATASATVQVDTPAAPVIAAPDEDQLQKIDTVIGKGAEATAGSTVYVHYTGWLYKSMALKQHGRKFDSSRDRGEPIDFVLGTGHVIKGWDQGILGMKVGGKRTLIIPSRLAYGPIARGDIIGANADLIFDVELVKVK
jgi:FKBP-type peptidyl-prolyl cis-trans isomerase FkpA